MTLRVFVDGRGLDVPDGATALDAVRAASADAGDAVVAGSKLITDSRGLPATPDSAAHGGAIYRVIPVRDRDAAPTPS